MHTLRRTLVLGFSFQQATIMCFVDFASAFDSVKSILIPGQDVLGASELDSVLQYQNVAIASGRRKDADGF